MAANELGLFPALLVVPNCSFGSPPAHGCGRCHFSDLNPNTLFFHAGFWDHGAHSSLCDWVLWNVSLQVLYRRQVRRGDGSSVHTAITPLGR